MGTLAGQRALYIAKSTVKVVKEDIIPSLKNLASLLKRWSSELARLTAEHQRGQAKCAYPILSSHPA